MKYLAAYLLLMLAACGSPGTTENASDSLPGVVTPPAPDTSAVLSPPPVNDSNVVNTDSAGTSR